jgi:hypothetical protein
VQIAFYFETGEEIKWGAAKNFAHDPAGMKVLLSGSMQACVVSTSIVILARVLSAPLYNGAETLLRKISNTFGIQPSYSWDDSKESINEVPVADERFYCDSPTAATEGDGCSIGSGEDLEAASASRKIGPARWYSLSISKFAFIAPTITIFILLRVVLRPKAFPYAHICGSLPYTLVEIWEPPHELFPGGCQQQISQRTISSRSFLVHFGSLTTVRSTSGATVHDSIV